MNASSAIVIGAGLAGLSATKELERAGWQVTVLEASDRVGGRVHTLHAPFKGGQFTEIGATRIPTHHKRVLALAEELGLKLIPMLPERDHYSNIYRGNLVREISPRHTKLSEYHQDLKPDEAEMTMRELEQHLLSPAIEAIGDFENLNLDSETVAHYDNITFAELLAESGASAVAQDLVYFDMYSPTLKQEVSALFLLRNQALLSAMKGLYKIEGGNDQLATGLYKSLASNVRFNAQCTQVTVEEGGYSVRYREGGHIHTVKADKVILAIPPTVLRRIRFNPGLSADKVQALQSWQALGPARLSLQFNSRFWQDLKCNGFIRTDIPGGIWDLTIGQEGTTGILEFYLRNQETVHRLRTLDEDQRIRILCQFLKPVFPEVDDIASKVIAHQAHFWHETPNALCGYNILPKGTMRHALRHGGTAEGGLHFAGAHTSPYCVWLEGALQSGQRVAQEILA